MLICINADLAIEETRILQLASTNPPGTIQLTWDEGGSYNFSGTTVAAVQLAIFKTVNGMEPDVESQL